MKYNIPGRVTAVILGGALGFAATACLMPVETADGVALAERIAYSAGRAPRRGDLVIVENAVFTEDGDGGRLLLTVAGLPGERVCLRAGRLLVNGDDVTEELGAATEAADDTETVAVEPGHLFLLSYRGQEGLDSRSEAVGQVELDRIWGRIISMGKEKSHGTEKTVGEQ